uniref:Sushi domain-containing protein n=1 Tax=Glossina austeni TaxID=7395 RepID=A0A1A9V5K9_GLOAU
MLIKFQFIFLLIMKENVNENSAQLIDFASRSNKWLCNSGELIGEDELCDGIVNCKDGSDETVRHCIDLNCPDYAFRCDYGACIARTYICDKKNDCADGSDETDLLCKQNITKLPEDIGDQCEPVFAFRCKSGECIPVKYVCDGDRDCNDGSDETPDLCGFSICHSYAFRCAYGACVPISGKCNGVMDCADNSDEENDECHNQVNDNHEPSTTEDSNGDNDDQTYHPPTGRPFTRPPPPTYLPPPGPPNRPTPPTYAPPTRATPRPTPPAFAPPASTPGSVVTPSTTAVKTTSRTIRPPSILLDRDDYNYGIRCPVLQPGISAIVSCSYQNYNISCKHALRPQSRAYIFCAPGYKIPRHRNYIPFITCEDDGKWNFPIFQCDPICGELDDKEREKLVKPWDVTIFRKAIKEYVPACSGVIVSHKIALTVMNCLTHDGRSFDVRIDQYKVVEGFYNATYKEGDVLPVRKHSLENIIIYYESNSGDNRQLVVLVLEDHISFSDAIKPICLEPARSRIHNRLHRAESTEKLNLGLSFSIEDSRHYLVSLVANLYDDNNGLQVEHLCIQYFNTFIKRQIERYSDTVRSR